VGLPSSSSHALFGGLIGASWVFAGSGAIKLSSVVGKVLVPLLVSPLVAGVVALAATVVYRIAARADRRTITRGFRSAQVVSASMVALAHGTNDAQETMGVITLTLITVGLLPAQAGPPLWVITAAGLAIAAGTAMGGWRIIRTLGRRISEIESPQGFVAETAPRSSSARRTWGSPCPPPRSPPGRFSAPPPAGTGPSCAGGWWRGWRPSG
jgi:inorganic phosphate transporter, PiT family